MTVKELIEKLQSFEDEDAIVDSQCQEVLAIMDYWEDDIHYVSIL